MRFRVSAMLIVALLGGAAVGSAQEQTGELFGKVTDQSGASLAGVTVTATSPVLLQPLTAITSETGSYRFARVAIGTYTVRFELTGFKTVVREGIRIEIGFNAQVNAQLQLSAVEETITVSGESPVVDTKQIGTGATFNQEMLQSIPSARDPWVILEQTPGISMDRQNIGGTHSGQQSGYVSRGASTGNNIWNLDGVNITDQAATGASPIYFDFDAFEEISISTGGNDASLQTGGVAISLVTKSGTDKFKGSSRYYVVSGDIQADNVDAVLLGQGAGSAAGAPVQNIKDYGFEAGGPIMKGRAWAWGSYGKQDIKAGILGFFLPECTPASQQPSDVRKCLATDLTVLKSYNIKGQAMPFQDNKVTWHSNFADKIRNARDGSDLRPIETTFVQRGPVWTHKVSDQHIFTDRLMADFTFAYVGGGFILDFHEPGLASVQPTFEITSPAGLWGRSFQRAGPFDRPITSVDATVNYFLPGALGGDHAFKAGFRWRDTPAHSESHFGGNTIARFRNRAPVEAQLFRDSVLDYGMVTVSGYAQDTYTRGRTTLNLGVRVDRQDDEALGSSVPAHPFLPSFLPAVTFTGADAGVVFTNVSPRIGWTHDIFGNGKTVAKASYGLGYSQFGPGSLSGILNPVTAASIAFPWNDLNGDRFVQANELDTSRILFFTGNYDPSRPGFIGTPNSVDPNLKNERGQGIIVGLDHEVLPNFGVGVAYIWRRYDRFRWEDTIGLTSADWTAVSYTEPCGNASCDQSSYTVRAFRPNIPIPGVRILTNRPDFWRGYNGFEVTARKRFAGRWMLNGSVTYNDARDHYDSAASYEDPTLIPFENNAQFAPEQVGSGRSLVFNNARWLVKVSGMYSLPWDINVSAFYNAHQGYPFIRSILTPIRGNRAGQIQVPLEPIGESRLENVHLVDFKVEKFFNFFDRARVSASIDVFNATNANTSLIAERQQNSTRANFARDIIPPRIARFGVRFTW